MNGEAGAGHTAEGVAEGTAEDAGVDWHRRVVDRSLGGAQQRSIDRGARLIRAAATVLERANGESLTVQDVADEAGQSLRTLYQYFASKGDLLLAVYEEGMRTYARMIRAAVAGLDDPVERLAGAVIAGARMPALHEGSGADRTLSQLRLQIGQVEPALIVRSQAPVTALYRELIGGATATLPTAPVLDVDPATYLLSSVRTSLVVSSTLGNEYGLRLPDVIDLSVFCLGGLGLVRPPEWHRQVDERLALAGADRSILRRLAREPGRPQH